MKTKVFVSVTLCLLCLSAAIVPVGCTDQQVAKLKEQLLRGELEIDRARKVVDEAKGQIAELEKEVAALPPGDQKDKAEEQLLYVKLQVEAGDKYISQLVERLKRLNANLETVTDGPDALVEISREVGQALPPPYGMYVSLGGLLLASIWRGARNRTQAREIVASVDEILTDEQKAKIRQSHGARRIVDEAQGSSLKLPI